MNPNDNRGLVGSSIYYGSGFPPEGLRVVGLDIASFDDVALMGELLRAALREQAGTPKEKRLAEWHNALMLIRDDAIRNKWPGWNR